MRLKQGTAYGASIGGSSRLDVGAVVGNMEAAGVKSSSSDTKAHRHSLFSRAVCQIQRTPIVNRTAGGGPIATTTWRQPQSTHAVRGRPATVQRHMFGGGGDTSFRTSASTARSDHSDSTADVENLLAQTAQHSGRHASATPGMINAQWTPRGSTAAQGAQQGKSFI